MAQGTGIIRGTVVDATNGEEMIGVHIVLQGTSRGSATNLDGEFVIRNVPAGTQTLVATYIGYEPVRQDVEVIGGETNIVNFEMQWMGLTGEGVTISAQAQGQVSAINEQLRSNTITNIVSADRIQELPDVNAAESIGRLPGVSIQRSGGEANRVAVRGLSPKFSTVSVNGVRVPSTGDWDRSIDLSLISSNMLDGIEVMKAITADQDADAVAGAINLRLREAPEQLQVDVSAQGGYTRLQDHYGNYKFVGSMSNRFLDNRIGVIANFNIEQYDRSADKFNAGYGQRDNPQTGASELVITSMNAIEDNVDRGRLGASVVLDANIPNGKINANAFFNRLNNEGRSRTNQIFSYDDNRRHYSMNEFDNQTSIMTAALGIMQDFDWVQYDATVSVTGSRAENPKNYGWAFSHYGAVNPFTREQGMDPREVLPFMIADSSLTALNSINISGVERSENQYSAQLNLQFPVSYGIFDGYFKTGGKVNFLDRHNDQYSRGTEGMHYGFAAASENGRAVREAMEMLSPDDFNGYDLYEQGLEYGWVPIYVFDDGYSRPDFMEGDYPLGYTADPNMLKKLTHALDDLDWDFFTRNAVDSRGRDYEGTEHTYAAYVMADFNIGNYVRFIPGFRWERDWSKYTGQQFREVVINNQQAEPVDLAELEVERTNNYYLPMVHLQFSPVDWADLRLARTETLQRPDFMQYVPITSIDSQMNYASAGNAGLKPAHSVNYDAALSFYTNELGLFSVAGFHKTIADHIIWTRQFVNQGELPDPDLHLPDNWLSQNPRLDTYINNPHDATYYGVELDWQTNLWYLPGVLQGIVLNLNYTRIFSDTKYTYFRRDQVCNNCDDDGNLLPGERFRTYDNIQVAQTREGRMVDQPAHLANVTVGYDYKGFSTRVSYLYQSDRANSVDATTPVFDTFTGEYSRIDMSVRQKLQMGLEFYVHLNNLLNTADRNFQGSVGGDPTYIEYYGTTVDIGMRYRF
ncbi:TonB-dependent receptor [Balneolales bacterium ANBcel1]|nr:TonB-dependent receptor [Balneolales bacterium ANBcel1]